jgi:hypothetical protein
MEILYNWAVALTAKGLYDAADLVYKRALSRRKDIDPYLRRIVRYGRADLYLRQGKAAMARKTFEQIRRRSRFSCLHCRAEGIRWQMPCCPSPPMRMGCVSINSWRLPSHPSAAPRSSA